MGREGLVIQIGVDPTGAETGSTRAGLALDGLNRKAGALGRGMPLVNEKLMAVTNTTMALSGVSGQAGKAFTLMAHGANLTQQAMAGMLGPLGLAFTAVGILTAAIISYVQEQQIAVIGTESEIEVTKTLVEELRTLATVRRTEADTIAVAKQRLADKKVQLEQVKSAIDGLGPAVLAMLGQFDAVGAGILAGTLIETKKEKLQLEAEIKALEIMIPKALAGIAAKAAVSTKGMLAEMLAGIEDAPITDSYVVPRKHPTPELLPRYRAGQGVAEAARQAEQDYIEKSKDEWEKRNRLIGESLAGHLTSGLMAAFTSGEEGFANMLKQWAAMLLESAVFSLIMMLFNPGKSFGSFFSAALGFQHGTDFVPRTGLAMVHRGEAIVPASQNIYNYNTTRNQAAPAGAVNSYTFNIHGITDPLLLAKKIESLTQRRLTRFALEG